MRVIVSLDAKLTNSRGLPVLQSYPSGSLITSGHTGRSLSWILEQLVFCTQARVCNFLTGHRLFSELLSHVNSECTLILLFSEKDHPGIWLIPVC